MFKNLLIPKFSSLLFFPQMSNFFLAHYSIDKFLSDSVSTNIFIVLLLSDNMTETFREDSVKHSVVELSPLVMETSWKCFMKDGNEVCRSQTESWQWLLSPLFFSLIIKRQTRDLLIHRHTFFVLTIDHQHEAVIISITCGVSQNEFSVIRPAFFFSCLNWRTSLKANNKMRRTKWIEKSFNDSPCQDILLFSEKIWHV